MGIIGPPILEDAAAPDGELDVVERVVEQPPGTLGAVGAALVPGLDHPAAGAGLDGQVDADTAQLCAPDGRGYHGFRRHHALTNLYTMP